MRDFEELFAFRLQYQDYSDDENYIIKKLKELLHDDGNEMEHINQHIYDFYNHYNINNISLEHIQSITILNLNDLFRNILLNTMNRQMNVDLTNGSTIYRELGQDFIVNLSTILTNPEPQTQDDIPVVLNDNDYENLEIKKYTDGDDECSICFCEMEKDDEYYKIKCDHIFHKDCIDIWLTGYNYKCPICREELGASQPMLEEDYETIIDNI